MSVKGFPPDGLDAGEPVLSAYGLELAPVPQQVRVARDFVRENLPVLDEDTCDTVLLLTSELVTNAVIHARTRLQVGLTVSERFVVVTVFDLDLGHREVPSVDLRDGGRGFFLVSALAQAWAVHHPRGGGKTVWFRIERDVPADVGTDHGGVQ